MPATAQLGFSQDAFDAFLQSRIEPDWLTDQRREAWNRFLQMDWPGRREEEWMRTDIRLFKLDKYNLPLGEGSNDVVPAPMLTQGVVFVGNNVTFDSRVRAHRLDKKWIDQGVVFGSLDQLLTEYEEIVRRHLLSLVDPTVDRFAALHAACWSGGSLLYVPKGVVVDQPLHSISGMSDGGIDLSHTLVILEDGAEATLITETGSVVPHGGGVHCGAIELFVGDNARLRFVSLQDWGDQVWHFAHQKARVGRDGNLQWTMAALGSRLSKVNQHVELAGEGAESQVNGALFTEGKQHLAYHTLQHHRAGNCRSDFLYKSALQDKSRTVWRGMIKVDQGAQKTDGYQRNDNMLLSSNARADSIPGLEIEADDVRCTHGSTSGRVNDEMIFYAQCRGFTRQEAIRLVVTGFFQQVFDRITIQSVRDALALAIARRVREYE